MKRQMMRAYLKKQTDCREKEILMAAQQAAAPYHKDGALITMSLFRFRRNIFLYGEWVQEAVDPERLFPEMAPYLETWAGQEEPRLWVPMIDIYHCLDAETVHSLRGQKTISETRLTVAQFKPEMLSSYIFYHYQYQEEKPGDFSQWCAIYLYENLAVLYGEVPDQARPMPKKRTLFTENTPPNWEEVMFPHFIPWTDTVEKERLWRPAECLWFL